MYQLFTSHFFVHSAIYLHDSLEESRKFRGNYLVKLFSIIDSPTVQNVKACRALKNILIQAYAFHTINRL